MIEKLFVTGTKIIQAVLTVGSFNEAIFRAAPVAHIPDLAVEAVFR